MTDLDIELAGAKAQVAAIEQRRADERKRKLEQEHRDLVTQCRTAKAEMTRLREEANCWRGESIRRRGEAENTSRHVANWSESKPHPSSYPSDEDLETWGIELKARQIAASGAEDAWGTALQEYEMARGAWLRARDAFDRLAERESRLREQLQPPRSPIETTVYDGAGLGTTITRQI